MKAIRLKKITYALCLALMASVLVSNRCEAQFSIPDSSFKAYLQKTIPKAFDASGNLITTSQEVTSLEGIDVSEKEIKSLDGIQFFTGLKVLYCDYNQLISLDISKNITLTYLSCRNNQLTNLDVSKNIDLKGLFSDNNQLSSLDVSKNIVLKELYCYSNQLASLDVSKNTGLTKLWCFINQFTSLDISKNTALEILQCSNNQLTSLDVSKNKALNILNCRYNQLTSLDVSKNTDLQSLECGYNQLTSLDVSQNTVLRDLKCENNLIKNLDIRGIRRNYLMSNAISKKGNDTDFVCNFPILESMLYNISNNPLKKMLIHTNMKDNELIKDVKTERGDALIISTYSAEEGSDNYTLECADYNPSTGVCK